jgi:hypothetical protein
MANRDEENVILDLLSTANFSFPLKITYQVFTYAYLLAKVQLSICQKLMAFL